jgi:hypothetical protein
LISISTIPTTLIPKINTLDAQTDLRFIFAGEGREDRAFRG